MNIFFIQSKKLIIPDTTYTGGTNNDTSFPYDIHTQNLDSWIMFIATYDEFTQKQRIELRNYFDKSNSPGKGYHERSSSSYTPATSSSRLYIGHGYGDGNSPMKMNLFKGNIDDIRIYSRIISDDEIDTIYNLSDSEPPIPQP